MARFRTERRVSTLAPSRRAEEVEARLDVLKRVRVRLALDDVPVHLLGVRRLVERGPVDALRRAGLSEDARRAALAVDLLRVHRAGAAGIAREPGDGVFAGGNDMADVELHADARGGAVEEDLEGRDARDLVAELVLVVVVADEGTALRGRLGGSGKVVSQSIEAGQAVSTDSEISVKLE